MKHITDIERRALITLLKGNRQLDSFTLFKRLKVGFSSFSRSILSLVEMGFVEEDDNNIRLTIRGAEYVSLGLGERGEKAWRKVPSRFLKTKMEPNQPYTPSIKLLDTQTFKNLKNDVE